MKKIKSYFTWQNGPDYWFVIPTFTAYFNKGHWRIAFMWLKMETGVDYDERD